jgi:hypothetical protein
MRRALIGFIILLGFVSKAYCQDVWDIARATVDGKKVAIEYGRPTLKGRSLSSLMKQLPADRIWRAGSGPVTVLGTETDLLIGGKKVPVGNYSVYMYCPEKGDYALIINSDLGEFSGSPLPKAASDRSNRPYPHSMDYAAIAGREVARVPLKQITKTRTEVLIYSFEAVAKGALLTIAWGDQAWTVEFNRPE